MGELIPCLSGFPGHVGEWSAQGGLVGLLVSTVQVDRTVVTRVAAMCVESLSDIEINSFLPTCPTPLYERWGRDFCMTHVGSGLGRHHGHLHGTMGKFHSRPSDTERLLSVKLGNGGRKGPHETLGLEGKE